MILLTKLSDFIGSLWVLLTLGLVSKFRFGGRYWSWRMATAFPQGSSPRGKWNMIRSGLEYARWCWRIRRL